MREPRSPGAKPRPPMPSQPLDSNPPLPAPACITNEILWDEVQILKGTTKEILIALKGNNLGNPGIFPTLEIHQAMIEENAAAIKKQKNKVAKWAAAAGGAAFALGAVKDWLLDSHKG